MTSFDAIVLAGGTSRRMGGGDKTAIVVGGQTILDRAIAAVEKAERIVVVGPPCDTTVVVTWTRENPPGGGPVPAVAAGVNRLGTTAPDRPIVILAGDVPFASSAIPRLRQALGKHDVALLVDVDNHDQYLIAIWQGAALRRRIAIDDLQGMSMRRLFDVADAIRVVAQEQEALDCDEPADITSAHQIVKSQQT